MNTFVQYASQYRFLTESVVAFDGKPSDAARATLKAAGARFLPFCTLPLGSDGSPVRVEKVWAFKKGTNANTRAFNKALGKALSDRPDPIVKANTGTDNPAMLREEKHGAQVQGEKAREQTRNILAEPAAVAKAKAGKPGRKTAAEELAASESRIVARILAALGQNVPVAPTPKAKAKATRKAAAEDIPVLSVF